MEIFHDIDSKDKHGNITHKPFETNMDHMVVPTCDIPVQTMPPQRKKNILMYAFTMGCLFIESCSVALATSRVPTRKEQSPLSDLVLDNVPYMYWCGKVAEVAIVTLGLTLIFIAITHKYG